MILLKKLSFCIGLFLPYLSYSQCLVVNDEKGEALENATILIKKTLEDQVSEQFTSNSEGKVILPFVIGTKLSISISYVGFTSVVDSIMIVTKDCINVSLQPVINDRFVIIYDSRIQKQSEIKLFRSDFLRNAATFDDPSRVLSKVGTIAPVNDQNNAFSYQGLPSHYMKWQINGGDIVNPNHLSNAGTAGDLYSPSSGGVNIISGQVINSFSYRGSTSKGYEPSQVSGTANVDLTSNLRPYLQLSLIGLESGGSTQFKNGINLMTNVRYSFTGLLADLGVDFGGEEIKYKDIVVAASSLSNGKSWNASLTYGDDSNFKDFGSKSQLWKSNTLVATHAYNHSPRFFNVKHITNFSQKNTDFNNDSTGIKFSVNERMLYHKSSLSYLQMTAYGIIKINQKEILDPLSENIASVGFRHDGLKYKSLNTYFDFPITYFFGSDKGIYLSPKIGTRIDVNEHTNIDLASAVQHYSFIDFDVINAEIRQSLHLNASLTHQTKIVSNKLDLFYHTNDDRLFFDEIWFNTLFYTRNQRQLFSGLSSTSNHAFGICHNFEFNSQSLYNTSFNFNTTLFRSLSKKYLDGNQFQSSLNDYRHIINGNISKTWKSLRVSFGFIHRGGPLRYAQVRPSSEPFTLRDNVVIERGKAYFRLDGRINYTFGKARWSLDLQNLSNRSNEFFYGINQPWGDQLGLLPNLSYAYTF